MPRLTTKHYLHSHKQLRHFWLTNDRLYAELSPTEQWQLHDYFKPDKDWTTNQLLEHRAKISKDRLSLPHQAGRALAKFHERAACLALQRVRAARQPAAAGKTKRSRDHNITVKAVVNPEIDVHRLARALLDMTADSQIESKQDGGSDGPSSTHSAAAAQHLEP